MTPVIIRDVEARDLPEIKEIINEIWHFSELFDDQKSIDTALGIYFNQVLFTSSFGKAALLDNKVVGVILGHVKGETPKHRMLLEDITKHILAVLNMTEHDRKNINEFMSKVHNTYEKLMGSNSDSYDGVLDFLILSEKARGLKIGKKLWDELVIYFKETNARSICVFTDSDCNFGFYEHIGFLRRGEQDITYTFGDEHFKESIFLYDYHFGEK